VKKKKAVFAAVAALAMVAPLAACSGGGNKGAASPKLTNCTNKIVNKSAPTVSVWAWYPLIIAFLSLQKYWRGGLSLGSID